MFAATAAEAQTNREPGTAFPIYPAAWIHVASPHHASTAAESYARGYADMVRAWGQNNLLTAQALVYLAEARRREIENRVGQTQAYFQMREINRSYRQRDRAARASRNVAKHSMRATQVSQESQPNTIPFHDGGIIWPRALQHDAFASYREVVEELVKRQTTSAAASESDRSRFAQAHEAMVAELRHRVHECSPQEYVNARRFLATLSSCLES